MCKVITISLANVGQLVTSAYAGLLLVRAHAVSGSKRLVLVVLGFLGVCNIIVDLVRSHISVVLEPV